MMSAIVLESIYNEWYSENWKVNSIRATQLHTIVCDNDKYLPKRLIAVGFCSVKSTTIWHSNSISSCLTKMGRWPQQVYWAYTKLQHKCQ